MTKFNVGDKVRILDGKSLLGNSRGRVTTGNEYKVVSFHEQKGAAVEHIIVIDNYSGTFTICDYEYKYIELVVEKPTKNQRITVLENEVAELKLIVHELRERPQLTTVINNAPQGPSTTNTVEDIIEFEGKQYRKVDREAREGDVVMQDVEHSAWMEKGHFYRVLSEGKVFLGKGVETLLYTGWNGSTVDTVNVYELIESKPLTPNQQRAAIIEKAKKFVEEKLGREHVVPDSRGSIYVPWFLKDFDFVVNNEKRTIVALCKGTRRVRERGIAKCNPSDVFNEHIGKAIAIGRALGLDVSEFEQAVQPTFAYGQLIEGTTERQHSINLGIRTCYGAEEEKVYTTGCKFGWYHARYTKILNDTNAKYEVGQ